MNIFKYYNIYLSLAVLGFVHIQCNCDGINYSLSPIQFNDNIFRRILSTNESVDVVEKANEETFINTNEHIDEKSEDLHSSNNREETIKQVLHNLGNSNLHGFGASSLNLANSILTLCNFDNENLSNDRNLLNQFLNGDVSNIFNENKSLFKDLLNKDICATYEINFDENNKCTLLTNKNDLQINKDILLLGDESEETNKLIDIWKRVVKNEENKFNLLKRNLYNQYLKHRNKSRLPHGKLNDILNECNMVVKKYNNNDDKTINEIFNKWSTVIPHNIFEFRIFVMAYRLTWRTLIKNVNTEYTELLKRSFK
ncbi:exported protein (PHISTb) [Plasmodium gaboni]|uniref:Exported protein (PHISTb) n=1 Tax=Plasmodium gaboni TaxID=647221 RepID=A0A151LUR2_9APIC|nr:exported protein (PHISTb) [Plasmodium gaboni]KYO02931.1 exported protein (PHISTb) [Plasmodium gaboni]